MLTIYKASAGSGKTYTLAYEYIRSLLGVKSPGGSYRLNHPKYSPQGTELTNRHRYILAITFTNKATEEMKRRIIGELDMLTHIPSGGEKDSDYAPGLCKDMGCSRGELAEVALSALRQLLYDYHSFNVTTIDSFFQRVLRTFARELDRQGDFNIELDDYLAVQQSVDNMLDDFNLGVSTTPPLKGAMDLGDWIYSFMSRQIDEGKKSNFFNRNSSLHTALVRLVATICHESFRPHSAAMREYLSDKSRLARYSKMVDERLKAMVLDMKKMSEDAIEAINADGGVYDALKPTYRLRTVIERNFLPMDDVRDAKVVDDVFDKLVSGESKSYTQKPFKDHEAAVAAAMNFAGRIRKKVLDYMVLLNIRDSLSQLWLLSYAWVYLDQYISENNTVLLSDTNHLLSTIIGGDETPFVYERMGVQLHHFLIDEFQDTSHMQWGNLRPLVANSMGEGFDNLIIGDEKQSIYRFRNSDPELLHSIVATRDFPVGKFDTRFRGQADGENTNYRSASDIVRFNNTLFTILSKTKDVEGYENVVQRISPKHASHRGYIHFIPSGKDGGLEAMAANIREQRGRKYDWGDIVVLVRTNKQAVAVVQYLLQNCPDIPVLSDEALYLEKSPVVQELVSMLRLVEQCETSASRREGKPYITASAADVSVFISRFEYFRSQGLDVPSALTRAVSVGSADAPDSDGLVASLSAIRERHPSTIVSLIETVIHEQLADVAPGQVAYLTAFQDFAADYCARYNPTLTAFLRTWDLQKGSLCIPMSTSVDAVRVMTVHKSKGLEFGCVHIPFGSWDVNFGSHAQWLETPHINGIPDDIRPPMVYLKPGSECKFEGVAYHDVYVKDVHNELVDLMNLLYVAYTRAEGELNVYYDPHKDLGNYLVEAFACGNPDPTNPLLCNLNCPVEGSDGEYKLGVLADKFSPDSTAPKRPGHVTHGYEQLDNYNVHYHKDASVLTCVDDVFATGDISDDGTDLPAADDDVYADDGARLRGIILHNALAEIDTVADIGKAVHTCTRVYRLTDSEAAKLGKRLRTMLGTPDERVQRWFAPHADATNEQSLYLPRLGVMRRPDRMVFCPDSSVEVIDYKFTSEPSPKHVEQVREYIGLLHDTGYSRVRGYLWYPLFDKPMIKEVKER